MSPDHKTLGPCLRGDDTRWVDVCALADIPVLGARVVERASGGNIAIFRNGDGGVFALLDRCPHKGGPLSQGIVFGTRVACPLHNWTIELESGCAMAPDEGCTQSFAVRVLDGRVHLEGAALDRPALEPRLGELERQSRTGDDAAFARMTT